MNETSQVVKDESNDAGQLVDFLQNAGPIFDEILGYKEKKQDRRKDKQGANTKLEIMFPQELQQIFLSIQVSCAYVSENNQVFVSHSAKLAKDAKSKVDLNLSASFIEGKPTKYFLTFSTITAFHSLPHMKYVLVGGTKDGAVLLWDMRETDFSHAKNHHEIIALIQSKLGENAGKYVLRMPNYSTEYLGNQGHCSSIAKIASAGFSGNTCEIITLEEFGKLIVWNVAELSVTDSTRNITDLGMSINSRVKMIKIMQVVMSESLGRDLSENNNTCFNFDIEKKSFQNIFVCCSAGIVKSDKTGVTKAPKNYGDNISSESFPSAITTTSEDLFYVGYCNGALKVFSKLFSEPQLTLTNLTMKSIVNIFVPNVFLGSRILNKKFEYLSIAFVLDAGGILHICDFKLLQTGAIQEVDLSPKEAKGTCKLLHSSIDDYNVLSVLYLTDSTKVIQITHDCSVYFKPAGEKIQTTNANWLNTLKSLVI
jgi:hypothetical protein